VAGSSDGVIIGQVLEFLPNPTLRELVVDGSWKWELWLEDVEGKTLREKRPAMLSLVRLSERSLAPI
jgi:hypothetical protein